MIFIQQLKQAIIQGQLISKQQAMQLVTEPLDELCAAADELRAHFCQNAFDICTIVNAKSGRCSEDCKYCAQSSYYQTAIEEYPLLDNEQILEQALYNDQCGVLRYSLVTSGRALSDPEIDKVCESIRTIRSQAKIKVCVSLGLLEREQFARLKQAGACRVHNNLETARNNFANICTTHTYDDKVHSIKEAQAAGLNVCSGGIMGLGESMEDRIEMVLDLRVLGVRSIPVNMLNPIPGTPYEHLNRLTVDEMRRIVAIFRFIIPDAYIRLAGGRGLLEDKGRSCFQSGANAAISGDMLTTAGISIENDLKMLHELGYEAVLCDD